MSMDEPMKNKKLFFLVYVLTFLAVFVLTSLTPMLADDYSYSFSYAESGKRIGNLQDIILSLRAHRQIMNGRMFSHGLAMLFLLLPKQVFNCFNALNAVLLLFIISRYFDGEDRRKSFCLLLFTACALWEFVPVFGQVFFWLDGSLNYSWSMTFILLFLYPFYCAFRGKSCTVLETPVMYCLWILIAFVAGAYSENASCAGIVMALFFSVSMIRRKKAPKKLFTAFAAACLGFAFLMTAPAERGRAAETDLIGIAKNIQRVFEAPKQELLPVYFIFAALLVTAVLCGTDKKVIWASLIFFLGSVVSTAVFIFAVYFPWRSLLSTTVFLIMACALLLDGIWKQGLKYPAPVLTAVLVTSFLFSFVLGAGDIFVMHMEAKEREATILAGVEQGVDPIEIHQYSANTKYAACYLLPDVYEDPAQWPNYDVAAYYGAGAVVGLPPVEEFGT